MIQIKSLYINYRPKTFQEVIGQDSSLYMLRSSINKNMTFHSYIFVGDRGIGKTTIARIFARAINCENFNLSNDLCLECPSCKYSATNLSQNEIMEVDSSSNRGINEMKELLEKTSYLPFYLKYRIVILDESHMLTSDAFGLLLKTLEEPPLHVIFILITTEYDKLPLTIRSRCQTIRLVKLDNLLLEILIKRIAKAEKLKIDDVVVKSIVMKSNGIARECIVLLQSLAAIAIDGKIPMDTDVVDNILNFETEDQFIILYDSIFGDISEAKKFFVSRICRGMVVSTFFSSFLKYLFINEKPFASKIASIFFTHSLRNTSLLEDIPFLFFLLEKISDGVKI